ncbi:MAG: pyridoxamine 5'-phosphate oxidase family protein [Deltaproteobacteria bacterium]|nr:pyridoxamine 5'-phosphate oxidase family protein [Deltaproteobacteria bacterium]
MGFRLEKAKDADIQKTIDVLNELFDSQSLAVLSTQRDSQPYCNLVAFIVTGDLKGLIFATTRATRKYENISSNSKVALLVDNRNNQISDFHDAMAVNISGIASELIGDECEKYMQFYLTKHPHLEDFVRSPSCALMMVAVESYIIVNRFQNVMVLHVEQ